MTVLLLSQCQLSPQRVLSDHSSSDNKPAEQFVSLFVHLMLLFKHGTRTSGWRDFSSAGNNRHYSHLHWQSQLMSLPWLSADLVVLSWGDRHHGKVSRQQPSTGNPGLWESNYANFTGLWTNYSSDEVRLMLQRMQACGQTVFGERNHHSQINSEKKAELTTHETE